MAVTPNYSWPVPVATDYVKDGWEAISDLGNAIDTTVAGLSSGSLVLVKSQTIGTAVSTVTVTDAFNTNYDTYKIVINGGVGSTTADIKMTLGATATGYYHAQFGNYFSGGSNSNVGNNDTTWYYMGFMDTNCINMNIDLTNPFLTKQTFYGGFKTAGAQGLASSGYLNSTTSYTAFTLTTTSGTMTGGTIRVYGYAKV
jgi:hypothetical protein